MFVNKDSYLKLLRDRANEFMEWIFVFILCITKFINVLLLSVCKPTYQCIQIVTMSVWCGVLGAYFVICFFSLQKNAFMQGFFWHAPKGQYFDMYMISTRIETHYSSEIIQHRVTRYKIIIILV